MWLARILRQTPPYPRSAADPRSSSYALTLAVRWRAHWPFVTALSGHMGEEHAGIIRWGTK